MLQPQNITWCNSPSTTLMFFFVFLSELIELGREFYCTWNIRLHQFMQFFIVELIFIWQWYCLCYIGNICEMVWFLFFMHKFCAKMSNCQEKLCKKRWHHCTRQRVLCWIQSFCKDVMVFSWRKEWKKVQLRAQLVLLIEEVIVHPKDFSFLVYLSACQVCLWKSTLGTDHCPLVWLC